MSDHSETLGEAIDALVSSIEARRDADPSTSYTASLLAAGTPKAARKFGEEAVETIVAALSGNKTDTASEAADAVYHLLVLLAAASVSPSEVATALASRRNQSGHAEKASRNGNT
jgi:phosphoribosyl-ATP pyrophosphohydrolase